MAKQFSNEVIAMILVEAIFTTEEKAAQKYGISRRSIFNYRNALAADDDLAQIFHTKKQQMMSAWADELPVAMRKAITFIAEASTVANPADPASIAAIAGAMKLCADVYYTGRVIDARIAAINRETNGIPREVPANSAADSEAVN